MAVLTPFGKSLQNTLTILANSSWISRNDNAVYVRVSAFSRNERGTLEKVQGATRIGATGLRASEREICL